MAPEWEKALGDSPTLAQASRSFRERACLGVGSGLRPINLAGTATHPFLFWGRLVMQEFGELMTWELTSPSSHLQSSRGRDALSPKLL